MPKEQKIQYQHYVEVGSNVLQSTRKHLTKAAAITKHSEVGNHRTNQNQKIADSVLLR